MNNNYLRYRGSRANGKFDYYYHHYARGGFAGRPTIGGDGEIGIFEKRDVVVGRVSRNNGGRRGEGNC